MQAVNLIPTFRRDAKQRRRLLRWCIAGCTAYAVAALAAAGSCRAVWGGDDPALDAQLAAADQAIDRSTTNLGAVNAELAETRAVDAASRHIAGQPDWSLLLALVNEQAGQNIMLNSCKLKPALDATRSQQRPAPQKSVASAAASAASHPRERLVLDLAGYGKSNIAVSEFVLRLERTGLFARVALIDTTREPIAGGGEVFGFHIESPLETQPQ
jgi:hypothetical protein